ncbi:MAG: hypothetical protein ACRDUA_16305 [Micromonosporaceae bacterium]
MSAVRSLTVVRGRRTLGRLILPALLGLQRKSCALTDAVTTAAGTDFGKQLSAASNLETVT